MIIIKLFTHALMAISAIIIALPALAKIEVSPLISDGAVFQRDQPITIHGKATPNESVAVAFGNDSQLVKSDAYGVWSVQLPSYSFGGPYTLTISTKFDSVTFDNILMGDIWVASGQSNMEWPLINTLSAEVTISKSQNPNIRNFKIPRSWASTTQNSLAGGNWLSASPATAGEFSAIAYYFAQSIYKQTGIPIGIVNSTWGGSTIEAWMSPKALNKNNIDTQQAIDLLVTKNRQQQKELVALLQRWPDSITSDDLTLATADWSDPTLSTEDWLTIQAPKLWENQGFTGMDGVAWYRKIFTLTAEQAAAGITLGLGKIDDSDITWVNGNKVGQTSTYDVIRRYGVDSSQLKVGENIIAVRVEDTGGGGGIYAKQDYLYLETANGEKRSLAGTWQFKAEKVVISDQMDMNRVDTALYNKMLYPLFGTPIKGIIWYQGESNANTIEQAKEYSSQFHTLITDWRTSWKNNELPFYWVQLASFDSKKDSDQGSPWAIVRDGQAAALSLPQTGQAITIDVGDSQDIHPRNKQTVGQRLANIALKNNYGKKNIHTRGPVVGQIRIGSNNIIVNFNSSKGLQTSNNEIAVKGFELENRGGQITAIDGAISGSSVTLAVKNPSEILSVRYAWSDDPFNANLIDNKGWPAEPFLKKIAP